MQTSINKAGQPLAIAGMISIVSPTDFEVSAFSEEATACISFGLGVKQGTKRNGVLYPTAQADVIQGIVKWSADHFPGTFGDLDQTATPPGLRPKAGMQLMRHGRIWVVVDAGVTSITPGTDRGFCRAVSDGSANTVVGAWGKVVDGTNNIDCTKQAVFVSALQLSADGVTKIAELEVDFTNKP